MRNKHKNLLILGAIAVLSGCGGGGKITAAEAQPVLESYSANLYAMYAGAVTDAQALDTKIEAFLTAPTELTLDATRDAWIASRANYMITEGARFYDGPIDVDPPNHEAALNSWPLDEAYIDYTTSNDVVDDSVGIVNNPSKLATIDADGLDSLNAVGGDENISDGYHAIEFLLWGQALTDVGPGTRPATDYVTGGPRPNVDRRKAYLRAAIAGVISHLTAVRDAWAPSAAYRTKFTAGGADSITLALTGLGKLSKGELAGERINAPYASKSRRDQHDCFSSLTLVDYTRDAQGILDMYLGKYGSTDGAGLDDLVGAHDAALNVRIKAALQASVDDMKAIPTPFEASIVGDDSSPGRTAIRTVVTSLRAQGDLFSDAASALGLDVTIPEEN